MSFQRKSDGQSRHGTRAPIRGLEDLEPRLLFAATVRTVVVSDAAFSSTAVADAAIDAAGDAFTVRDASDSYNAWEVVEVPAGGTTPTAVAPFAPLGTDTYPAVEPTGHLILDAAGDLFGTAYASYPESGQSGQGLIWEVVAGSGTVTAIARTAAPNQTVQSLTRDAAGDLFGTVDDAAADTGPVQRRPLRVPHRRLGAWSPSRSAMPSPRRTPSTSTRPGTCSASAPAPTTRPTTSTSTRSRAAPRP